MSKIIDLTGKKFGKLKVLGRCVNKKGNKHKKERRLNDE